MSGQAAIQGYLERHKIGALFEDLMGKLINDQPDEPYHYLIRILQLKADKKGVSHHMRKSMGDADALAVAKDRKYEKPWQSNSKRLPPKQPADTKAALRKSMPAKPEWDSKTKSPTVFDDFWEDNKKGSKGQRSKSPSRIDKRMAAGTWTDNDEELLYRSYGYSGPRRAGRETDDPLAGEFSVVKEKPEPEKQQIVVKSKQKGQDFAVQKHKKELERYILSQKVTSDSGFEEEPDLDPVQETEMLEDADLLEEEGVRSAKRTGVKSSKKRNQGSRSNTQQVKVSICARCAQVMSGGRPSTPVATVTFDDIPDLETHRPGGSTARQSSHYTENYGPLDDDEFESVSQVTGPRKPVWQDKDTDALTPRKGTHMFSSNKSPTKGFPMFNSERLIASAGGAKSRSPTKTAQVNQSWSPQLAADVSSDVVTKPPAEAPPTKSPDEEIQQVVEERTESNDKTKKQDEAYVPGEGGSGWKVLTDYDTDASSIYGAVSKGEKRRGTYQGAF